MVNRSGHRFVVYALLVSLAACSGPQPILRSNKQLHLYGKQMAQQEIESCRKQVEKTGLRHGTNQSANAATGAVLGLTLGGAVGASAGVVGGLPGVTIGSRAPVAGSDSSLDCSGERSCRLSQSLLTLMLSRIVLREKAMRSVAGNRVACRLKFRFAKARTSR